MDSIIKEMKENALNKRITQEILKTSVFEKPLDTKIIEVEGEKVSVALSYDVWSDKNHMWHMSISNFKEGLNENLIQKIVQLFLGDGYFEMPSLLFPGKVRQFLKAVEINEN